MHCASFDIFRTLGFPDTTVLKPDQFLRHKELLRDADWVLFPEYWQLNTLVHGLKCRVFPSIASYRIGHDKVEMTRVFQAIAPEHTPWTLITANGPQEREQIWQDMALPFVAKLPKASMGEGVWLIENRADWQRYCDRTDVLYAQEYLPLERDARELGVDHAGFDIALVEGYPFVLEFNRLFGNQGLGQGTDLQDAILAYLHQCNEPRNPEEPMMPDPVWPVAV